LPRENRDRYLYRFNNETKKVPVPFSHSNADFKASHDGLTPDQWAANQARVQADKGGGGGDGSPTPGQYAKTIASAATPGLNAYEAAEAATNAAADITVISQRNQLIYDLENGADGNEVQKQGDKTAQTGGRMSQVIGD
jgi:hypothetical protein